MTAKHYDFERARAHFEDRNAFTTGTHELQVLKTDGKTDPASYQVIDVRFPDDYATGHVPGAINLPMAKWGQSRHLETVLNKDATLYLYCYNATCHLAAQAGAKLVAAGYKVVEVEGGFEDWVAKGFEVEKAAEAKSA
jgi:rhodanese-related sulfurtransferase